MLFALLRKVSLPKITGFNYLNYSIQHLHKLHVEIKSAQLEAKTSQLFTSSYSSSVTLASDGYELGEGLHQWKTQDDWKAG